MEKKLTKKQLLKQVESAIYELESLQNDLDDLFQTEDINIDPDYELTQMLNILVYFEEKIKENDDIKEDENEKENAKSL